MKKMATDILNRIPNDTHFQMLFGMHLQHHRDKFFEEEIICFRRKLFIISWNSRENGILKVEIYLSFRVKQI